MPKKISKEELEKLSLRERLEKLREIAKEDEEELKETEELIKKTEKELISRESSTDTGPAPETKNLGDIVEKEAPPSSSERPRRRADTAKYESYTPDYTAIEKPAEPEKKLEEVFEYKMAHEDTSKSTATRTTDKDMKKYSRG